MQEFPYKHLETSPLSQLNTDLVLHAYQTSYFPMAEYDNIYWHSPDPRAIIPLSNVRVSKSLRKTIEKQIFEIRINTSFENVILGCCERREDTWISHEIIRVYSELSKQGYAHCIESWKDGELVGGLYGIALGSAFFGESMFSRVSDASKVAFIALTEYLSARDFTLLDSQYINAFTHQLGAVEIPRAEYQQLLQTALTHKQRF